MLTPKISVIVPVYNAGPFFQKRLDTLTGQTLKEIEIILVLDCPTDGSDKVAEEYVSQDNRIILIHNERNLHIGLSRNEGLKKARGEYICFSDHDDYSELDMLEKLYRKAKEKEADVVVSDFYRVTEDQLSFSGFPENNSDKQFQKDSFSYLVSNLRFTKNKRSITSNGVIWNQIYRREFLNNHKICFRDNREITFEDRMFLIEVYYHAEIIVRLPEAFYYHIFHQESTGGKYNYKSVNFVINYLMAVYQFLDNHHIYEQEAVNYGDGVLLTLYSTFRNELRYKSLKDGFRVLSVIRSNKILQQAIRPFYKAKNIKNLREYRITKLCFLILITKFL